MKKLLSILASVGLVATASTAVVSCMAIQHLGNPINETGDVTFKSKAQFILGMGAIKGEDSTDKDYYDLDNTKMGDVANPTNPIDGVTTLRSIEVVDPSGKEKVPAAGDSIPSAWYAQDVTYKVKKDDVKDAMSNGKQTKQVNAYIEISFPAKENGLWYKYYSQEMSWSVAALDDKGNIGTYCEAFEFEIPRTDKPAIDGNGEVSADGKSVTIKGENMINVSQADLDKVEINGTATAGIAKVVNGNLVLNTSSFASTNGVYTVDWGADQYGIYDGPIIGNASFTIANN